MTPYRVSAAADVERFSLRAPRRFWALGLAAPFLVSMIFFSAEIRTLHAAPGLRPTDTDGFDMARTDTTFDPKITTLRVALAVLALFGIGAFIVRERGADVIIDRGTRIVRVVGGPLRVNATAPLDAHLVIVVRDDGVWLHARTQPPIALATLGVAEEELVSLRLALPKT